ncbi:nuclear envelope-associated protein 2-like [Brassica napus]|nr:nuclear envelope-associated protein 2-like [Brassica napus]
MECELRKILEEVSPKSIERMNRLLSVKDEEIAKLKDEVRLMSAHWKLKTKGLETQLEKQRRTDQELKKKVVKLEFCLQEAGSQTRKLQRMGEKRDKAIKELRDQITGKQWNESVPREKPNFWDTSGFKIVVSMSMLLLVIVSKK